MPVAVKIELHVKEEFPGLVHFPVAFTIETQVKATAPSTLAEVTVPAALTVQMLVKDADPNLFGSAVPLTVETQVIVSVALCVTLPIAVIVLTAVIVSVAL